MKTMGWIATGVLVLASARFASAQTYTWTNAIAGNQPWSTAENWTGGTPADGGAAGVQLIFNASAANNMADNDFASPFVLNHLRFQAGAISVAGGTLVFTNSGATMPMITNNTGVRRDIANDLLLGTNLTIGGSSSSAGLLLSGGVDLGGGFRQIAVLGVQLKETVVTNSGSMSNGGLLKTGGGLMVLSGANTYALGTRVNAGVLQFDSLGSIGGSGANVTNAGGAIGINFAGFMDAVTNRIGLISSGSLGISAANAAEAVDFRPALFSNAYLAAATGTVIYDLGNHTPYVNAAATGSNIWRFGGGHGTLVVTNAMTGGDTVVIGGGGSFGGVVLAGTNSYTGTTTIQNGMLLVVSNAAPAGGPSTALGATSRIIVNNGTLSLANVIVTNAIYVAGGGNNAQNNGAALQFWGGTTNEIRGLLTFAASVSAKANTGGGAGMTLISGGVLSTNLGLSFYDDTNNDPFIFTNNPIRLGTGALTVKNAHIGVSSNVVGGLNIQWGNKMLLTVDDAFVGAVPLLIGTIGNDNLNWMDLNGHNLTLSGLSSTGSTFASSQRQYLTGGTGSLLTFTNGPGARSTYPGYLTNAVSLVKTGAGILDLRGVNTHTGTTIVDGGALVLGAGGRITASAVTVTNGSLLVNNTTDAIGNLAGLQVVGGGAIGTTGTLDQAFVDWAYGSLPAVPAAFALSADNSGVLDFTEGFGNPSFLGAAPLSNMTFTGSAGWGDTTVRLGGGGGKLIYMPAIGPGTNLLAGPAGGNLDGGVVLLAANSHDRTAIQSGSLFITNDAALGAVPAVPGQTNLLLNGGILQAVSNNVSLHADRDIILGPSGGGLGADAGRTLTVPQVVGGEGALTKIGAGTVILGGANTYTGGTFFLAGALNVSNDAALGAAGDGASLGALTFNGGALQVSGSWTSANRAVSLLAGGGTFNVDTNRTFTITNGIGGAGGLIKTGMGTLVLPGSNSYSGGTIVSGIFERNPNSAIQISNPDALGTGGIVLTNGGVLKVVGGIAVTNSLLLYGGDQATSYSGALVINGGDNIWGGHIVVTTLSTRIAVNNGASLRITNGLSGAQLFNFAVASGSLTVDTVPITSSSLIMFSGGNNNLGTNYLNVAGSTFGSGQIWQGGLLVLGVNNALPTNAPLTIGDRSFLTRGTLDLNGFNQTIGNLYSGTNFNASFITNRSLTPATLTVNQTADSDFLGTIAGSVSFVKNGAATLILAVPNTHSNGTGIGGGTLQITNETALGAAGGPLALSGGGTLRTTASMLLADRTVTLGAGGGAFNTDAGTSLEITNSVIGPVLLQKNGAGALALGGITDTSNLWVNAGSVLNTGAMTVIGGGAGSGDGLRILNSAVLTNSGSVNMPSGKLQLYNSGRLVNQGPITNGYAFVMAEAGTAGHTVVDNLAGGSLVMPGGTMYIGLYYASTFNNDGGDVLQNGNVAIGPPTWVTTVGSNTIGTLNVNGGLFNFTGGGTFQIGGNVGQPNGTGIVNLAGGVLALNKGITKGTNPDVYGFVNFNGGTLSGTVNNVTLLGTGLSAVTVQAGGGTVALAAGITNTISAAMQNGGGGGGLTKGGEGVLRLTGASLYAGTTRVAGGVLDLVGTASLDNSATLQIDAGATLMASNLSSTLHLKSGQTIKGNGTFVGGLITDGGSTVAPGASAGTLTVTGDWTLDTGSTFTVELNGTTAGTQYDQLVFTGGSLTLSDPNLNVVLGFTPAYNDVFTIIAGLSGYDPGVDGIFTGKADGSTFVVGATEFQIDYNPTDVTLTVVPEPMTSGLAGFVVLAGWLLRRRSRRR